MFYGDGNFYGDGWLAGEGLLQLAAPLTSEGYDPMDAEQIERKQGDTLPLLDEVLKDANGAALNLSDASVAVYVTALTGGSVVVNGAPCVIVDALGGQVQYDWADWGLSATGAYKVEFLVTFGDGTKLTVPTGTQGDAAHRYRKLLVYRSLRS